MRVRSRMRTLALLLLGVLIGISTTWCLWTALHMPPQHRCAQPVSPPPAEKGFVLIGIMTAAKYVDTRAYHVWKTWAQHIPGKVLFFVSEHTQSAYPDMPLIRLKGVDDTYPPQKKSFAMVRWMADNHLENYEWFVRADDDLYIKGEELEKLLRGLDSSRAHAIGQAGLGNSAEYGLLALGATDNYCMGGPGVVLSRETLRLVAPHLQDCLAHVITTHEDVELGRCIRRHVGVACTWNYEMQKLFHNNQSATLTAYTSGLEEVKNAISVHPIKEPRVMQRVHAHVRSVRLQEVRSRRAALAAELSNAKQPSLTRSVPQKLDDIAIFKFVDSNRILFCAGDTNCPRHTVEANTRNEVARIVTQYFYQRVEPRYGVDYILDMVLWFKKFRPPHRTTLSVRRHAYVQQSFAPPVAVTDEKHRQTLYGVNGSLPDHIHLILPLKGRATVFARFATHLRNICMRAKQISLVVVLYSSEDEDENRATVDDLRSWLRVRVVEMGSANFSRGVALTRGVSHLPSTALLFFTDVDMLFTCDALHRIRLNTVYGAQVYFPIVFSEFSPDSWSENDRLLADAFHYGRRRGYFRHFGYGLAALFKGDFEAVGGFNTSITGWGMEDVDLFEKAVKSSNIRVMRAPEPGLVHIYHPIHCDVDMPKEQLKMCRGSKAASLASLDALVDQIQLLI